MGSIFNKLFRKKQADISLKTPECMELLALKDEIDKLCVKNHYVARSEYCGIMPKYEKVIEYFSVLDKSRMLDSFCAQHQMNSQMVLQTLHSYYSLDKIIEQANDEYIATQLVSEKEYLDNILHAVDPVIKLDNDQRKVIFTNLTFRAMMTM